LAFDASSGQNKPRLKSTETWKLNLYAVRQLDPSARKEGTAAGKIEALREAGIAVADTPAGIAETLIKNLKR
jgi:succinyl-CoA synthetase alpha subunit